MCQCTNWRWYRYVSGDCSCSCDPCQRRNEYDGDPEFHPTVIPCERLMARSEYENTWWRKVR